MAAAAAATPMGQAFGQQTIRLFGGGPPSPDAPPPAPGATQAGAQAQNEADIEARAAAKGRASTMFTGGTGAGLPAPSAMSRTMMGA